MIGRGKGEGLCTRTHMFLRDTSSESSIQEPVMHGLVAQGDAANVFSSVHVPRPNTHLELLGNGIVVPSVYHGLLERDGC